MRAETDRGMKIVQSTALGPCCPSGITTVSLSSLAVHSDSDDRCCNKDQVASGWQGLKGAHGVVGLSRSLRTLVTLQKVSSSIPDVSTVDKMTIRLFSSLSLCPPRDISTPIYLMLANSYALPLI